MSPYITFRDHDSKGELQYYILQRDYPHFCGRVDYFPSTEPLCQVPVTGHHLYISYAGTLRGNIAPVHEQFEREILFVFHSMALWFYSERIMKDPKRYRKWLVT
jgi:hypothetical protein